MSRRPRTYVDLDLNPVRAFRKSKSLTINDAAIEADVNIQTWYLAERGACKEVPFGIVNYILDRRGIKHDREVSKERIQMEFRNFQQRARQGFWKVHGDRIINSFEGVTENEPINFLERVIAASRETPVGLSKNLCIAPTVLMATLNGRRQKLPREILLALVDAGWPVEQIFNTGVRI